ELAPLGAVVAELGGGDELAVDVEVVIRPHGDDDLGAAAVVDAGLFLDAATAQAEGAPGEPRPWAALDDDDVEQAVVGVGVDLGAPAERAGAADRHLPGVAVEDLGPVADDAAGK